MRVAKRIVPKTISGGSISLELDIANEQADLQKLSERLISVLRRLPGRWLLIIDELPIFVTNLIHKDESGVRARQFLEWFRKLRQGWDGAEHFRWILAGSIGLDLIAAQHNLGDTINDLRAFELKPFSPEIADEFLSALAASYGLTFLPEVREHAVRRLEWASPYFLQLLFGTLLEHCKERDVNTIEIEHISIAFQTLLDPAGWQYLDYWRQRLFNQLDKPRAVWAKQLLCVVARWDQGVSRNVLENLEAPNLQTGDPTEDLSWLLRMLEADGYLTHIDGVYRFRSPLLRDYWRRSFNV
jgi:hypothetical protein